MESLKKLKKPQTINTPLKNKSAEWVKANKEKVNTVQNAAEYLNDVFQPPLTSI